MMKDVYVRVGIDVGGTHTKAVAINEQTGELIAKASVKTTHDAKGGVAKGVIDAFYKCLEENDINPQNVSFIAHSTTQATNALIEGDVAKIGIIGLGRGLIEGFFVKTQTTLKPILLDKLSNKKIDIKSAYFNMEALNMDKLISLIQQWKEEGVEVVVGSASFGVDDNFFEEVVTQIAQDNGLFSTMASNITKLYGLTRRTRTAVINASILPKMLRTANSTESAVRDAGVHVPLMIMRGDGGVMEINEMKKRPVLTMLSGPAASVMGSLTYLRASNGIYFEVGGTTTNIGVIKNGRPAIDYSEVGGYKTHISSLDVKVLGVAGGSMVRANKKGIVDIGPRSAHIAGLEYAAFTDSSKLANARLEFFSPKDGDPSDYVKVVLNNNEEITITTTCAANALKLVTKKDFSFGNQESSYIAISLLAEYIGISVIDCATGILDKAYHKIQPVITGLIQKYQLEADQISLVGVGGGAASLLIYIAKKMDIAYSIPKNAEVISSIGVALSMVRDVVERVIPSPSKEDIKKIKSEAIMKAIASGATLESVDVHIDIDTQTSKITAIASGSTEVKTKGALTVITEDEACKIAAKDMKCEVSKTILIEKTKYFYVFGKDKQKACSIRIIDNKGFIKVQKGKAVCCKTKASSAMEVVAQLWEDMAVYKSELIERPEYYLCFNAKVMDFSSLELNKLQILMQLELEMLNSDEDVLIVACSHG